MTQNATVPLANKARRTRPSRRSTWLKLSIVAGSIVATLTGAQGIAWLERAQRAEMALPTPAVIARVAQTSAATPAAATVATATAAPLFSIQGLLPTVTPTAALATDAVAVAAIIPTEPPTATPTLSPTPTLAPTPTPVSVPVQPVARSRSSR